MADSKAGAAEAAPAAKKNLKPLILAIAAVVLLGGGGAAAYFLMRPNPDAAANAGKGGEKGKDGKDSKDSKDKKKDDVKRPFFVEFEPFTVNMKDPDKFLQIKLTFQVKNSEQAEVIKDLMPIVRSAVIPVLAAQDAAELETAAGKDKLCVDTAAAANKALAASGSEDAVEGVLITHMIIQ